MFPTLALPAHVLLTLAAGALGAIACARLGIPLPWVIGPLLVTAGGCMAGVPMAASMVLPNAGQWAIGTALGCASRRR